jgi:hypothetical protein
MLSASSCRDRLFDFNVQNIEANGEWGIPVYNGDIDLERFMQNMDSSHIIQVGENGVFKLVLEQEFDRFVDMHHIFNIGNKSFDTTGVFIIEELPSFHIEQVLPFSLNNENVLLKNAIIKSGTMDLIFNISAANFTYTATLTTHNITDANGTPLSMTFSNSQPQHSFNLSNYVIHPNEMGIINISADITVNTSAPVNQITYECHTNLTNFVIQSLTGQFNAINLALDKTFNFSIPLKEFQFNQIRFNNPKVTLYGKNSLCPIGGNIDELSIYSNHGSIHPLLPSSVAVNSPLSSQYIQAAETNLLPLQLNQNIDSLKLRCNFIVNPNGYAAGDIHVDENSALGIKIKTEFPTNISIDNAVYRDTINNSLHNLDFNLSTLQSIEELTLRAVITNYFPFELTPTIDFWDSQTGDVFHVDLDNLHIRGAYNDIPYVNPPIFLDFSYNDAQKILKSDKIIIGFRVSTNGNDVEINNSQKIHIALGAEISYSQINL